jgi:hypothetical protein
MRSGTRAAAVGIAGWCGSASSDRDRRRQQPAQPLSGHRRLQACCRVTATGPGHGGSDDLGDERSRCVGLGPLDTVVGKRVGDRGRLAACRTGAALRIHHRGSGAAFRSQRELGFPAVGVGRTSSQQRPAGSARWFHLRPCGDEVFGSGGAREPGRLRAHGGGVCHAPVHHTASHPDLCRLARSAEEYPAADSGRAAAVFENPTTSRSTVAAGRRVGARSGDGGSNRQPCGTALRTGRTADGSGATEGRAPKD